MFINNYHGARMFINNLASSSSDKCFHIQENSSRILEPNVKMLKKVMGCVKKELIMTTLALVVNRSLVISTSI
jgi:hypothetical protein